MSQSTKKEGEDASALLQKPATITNQNQDYHRISDMSEDHSIQKSFSALKVQEMSVLTKPGEEEYKKMHSDVLPSPANHTFEVLPSPAANQQLEDSKLLSNAQNMMKGVKSNDRLSSIYSQAELDNQPGSPTIDSQRFMATERQTTRRKKFEGHGITESRYKRPQGDMELKWLNKIKDDTANNYSAQYFKQEYIKQYGFQFPLPAIYIVDTQLYPPDMTYSFSFAKIALPPKDDVKILNHDQNGQTTTTQYQELYRKYSGNLLIRLQNLQGNFIKNVDEAIIENAQTGLCCLSNNGQYLAYLAKDQNESKSRFCIIQDDQCSPQTLIEKIKQKQTFKEFPNPNLNMDGVGNDFSFIKHLKFDSKNQVLLGYGDYEFMILNLHDNKYQRHKIQPQYQKILYLDYHYLNGAEEPKCIVAFKSHSHHEIVIEEFQEEQDNESDDQSLVQFQVIFDYKYDLTDGAIVKISSDLRKIVFANQFERFILEEDNKCYFQRNILGQSEEIIRYVKEDHLHGGFYLVYSMEYDISIKVMHTDRSELHLQFSRQVEPGTIQINDFQVGSQFQKDPNRNYCVMAGMRDDDFTIDWFSFKDTLLGDKLKLKLAALMSGGKPSSRVDSKLTDIKVHQYKQNSINAMCVNWPYVTFSGLMDGIIVLNAYLPKECHRIVTRRKDESLQDKISLCASYITEKYGLFTVIAKGGKYYLYHFDLNESNPMEQNPEDIEYGKIFNMYDHLLEYDESFVDFKHFSKIQVQCSPELPRMNGGFEISVLILHEHDLYTWSSKSLIKGKNNTMQYVAKLQMPYFFSKDDSTIFYLENCSNIEANADKQDIQYTHRVQKLELEFSDYSITNVYSQSSPDEKVVSFNYDEITDKLLLVIKCLKKPVNQQSDMLFKIFDIEQKVMQAEVELKSPELISRLLYGQFIPFVDGHLYFGNNVIKVRYDKMESESKQKNQTLYMCKTLTENNFFDFYSNIFDLNSGMRVRTQSPLMSQKYHRFGYVIQDSDLLQHKTILITPQLQEKRLYLNRCKRDAQFFYTTVQMKLKDEYEHEKEGSSSALEETPHGHRKDCKDPDIKKSSDKNTRILSLNLLDRKYYVYTLNGILLNRQSIYDFIEQYGNFICCSSDGQNIIFKKNESQLRQISNKTERLKMKLTFTVAKLTPLGMIHVKNVCLQERIQNYIKSTCAQKQVVQEGVKLNPIEKLKSFENFQIKYNWLFPIDKSDLDKKFDMRFDINDNLDIFVRMRYRQDHDNNAYEQYLQQQTESLDTQIEKLMKWKKRQELAEKPKDHPWETIYYVEHLSHGFDMDQYKHITETNAKSIPQSLSEAWLEIAKQHHQNNGNKDSQKLYLLNEEQFHETEFVCNIEYLILWNWYQITYYPLTSQSLDEDTMINLDLKIDPKDQTCICDVRATSDPNRIVININNNVKANTVIRWDLISNAETSSFEICKPFDIIQDQTGCSFILEDPKKIYRVSTENRMITYDIQNLRGIQQSDERKQNRLTIAKGQRFDGTNHNWVIIQEYLALPFCYMSFVIQQKAAKKTSLALEKFDPSSYNYIFNQKTTFMDPTFLANHKLLKDVLANLEKTNPMYLDLLNYTSDKLDSKTGKKQFVTALHIALSEGHNKSIEIILHFLSKIKLKTSVTILDIYPKLMEFKKVIPFIDSMVVQTQIMTNKNTLSMKETLTPEIVAFSASQSLQIDNLFWQEEIGEQKVQKGGKKNKFYSVDVIAIKIDWMLKDKEGKDFFMKITNVDNLNFFKIDALKMTISFLYYSIKQEMLIVQLPLFLLDLGSWLLLSCFNEMYHKNISIDPYTQAVTGVQDNAYTKWIYVSIITHTVFTVIQLSVIIKTIKGMGKSFFMKYNSWIDFILMIVNAVAIFMFFTTLTLMQSNDVVYYETYKTKTQAQRKLLVFGLLIKFYKMNFFLSLIDSLAPLIDLIVRIQKGIMGFGFVLIMVVIAMSFSFYMIGQNQIDFSNIEPNKIDSLIVYNTLSGSIFYIVDMIFGGKDARAFNLGDQDQAAMLFFLFFIACFIIKIHLLNMLISIMRTIFQERARNVDTLKLRDYLVFVIENWFLIEKVIDKSKAKYLITAFNADLGKDENQLKSINKDISTLNNQMNFKMEEMQSAMQQILQAVQVRQEIIKPPVGPKEVQQANQIEIQSDPLMSSMNNVQFQSPQATKQDGITQSDKQGTPPLLKMMKQSNNNLQASSAGQVPPLQLNMIQLAAQQDKKEQEKDKKNSKNKKK